MYHLCSAWEGAPRLQGASKPGGPLCGHDCSMCSQPGRYRHTRARSDRGPHCPLPGTKQLADLTVARTAPVKCMMHGLLCEGAVLLKPEEAAAGTPGRMALPLLGFSSESPEIKSVTSTWLVLENQPLCDLHSESAQDSCFCCPLPSPGMPTVTSLFKQKCYLHPPSFDVKSISPLLLHLFPRNCIPCHVYNVFLQDLVSISINRKPRSIHSETPSCS